MTKLEQAEQLLSEMTPDEKAQLFQLLVREFGSHQAVLDALDDTTWIDRAREAAKSGFASPEQSVEFIQRMLNADTEPV